MPGRGRSPVQQAWDYAIDAPGSRWVLVSNCLEIRLYGFGRGRDAYEVFDLTRLDEPEEHARLWLILSAGQLLGGPTDRLLRETDSAYKDVTARLYEEYRELRSRLIGFLTDAAEGPKLSALDGDRAGAEGSRPHPVHRLRAAHRSPARPAVGGCVQGAKQIPAAADLEEFPRLVPRHRSGQRPAGDLGL